MVDDENTAKAGLQSMGLFSYTNLQFVPRSTQVLDSLGNVQYCDTLDANIDLVFDKPYDFYVEANAKGKTTGRVGPELVVGLTKRNAFRGGEKLDINFHGSHEWQTITGQGEVPARSIPMSSDQMSRCRSQASSPLGMLSARWHRMSADSAEVISLAVTMVRRIPPSRHL